jgi:hypothetical protein
VAIEELEYDWLAPGTLPITPADAATTDYVPVATPDSVGVIETIVGAKAARDQLYGALAAASVYGGANGTLDQMAASAAHLFSDAPMTEATPV